MKTMTYAEYSQWAQSHHSASDWPGDGEGFTLILPTGRGTVEVAAKPKVAKKPKK